MHAFLTWSRALVAAATVALAGAAVAGPIAATPYLSFAGNSPFAAVNFGGGGYFHLENFEDSLVNTPGLSMPTGGGNVGPGGITDSVDEDDGAIDGSGQMGRSRFSDGATGFVFNFEAGALGALPTHVGIVWTDGAAFNDVTFRAFGPGNVLLGEIIGLNIGDGVFTSGTAEDRFFGWTDAGGIESMQIFNSRMTGGGSGIEVDHVQYGRALTDHTVPEPGSSLAMALAALALAATLARRRHGT